MQRVARDTLEVLADPATLEKLRGIGFDVRASGPQGLAQRVAREVPMWRDIIVQSRIELQQSRSTVSAGEVMWRRYGQR